MRVIFGVAAMCLLSSTLTGCASWHHSWGNLPGPGMPNTISVTSEPNSIAKSPMSQPVLSSMRQWEIVAADVAKGLCASIPCNAESKPNGYHSRHDPGPDHVFGDSVSKVSRSVMARCMRISVRRSPGTVDGAFRAVLSEGIIGNLLSDHAHVYGWHSSQGRQCDKIVVRTVVTHLNGTTHTGYYAGELTTLAGVGVVLRHVIRAATEAKTVATVGLGELAYWLSPSYLTRHPMAEVAVSVSQETTGGRYLAQYTNVYYINAKDIWAYVDPRPRPDWTALNNRAAPP